MYASYTNYEITNAGDAIQIDIADQQHIHFFYGVATLGAGYSVTASAAPTGQGASFKIFYNGTVTYSGGNVITIFGTAMSQAQALAGPMVIDVIYNFDAAAWEVYIPTVSPGAFSSLTPLTVPVLGVLYPAASAGQVFRLICPGQFGRLGAVATVLPYPAPPDCEFVFNDYLMYCVTSNSGGTQAAVGANFWIAGQPPAFTPIDNTNGTGSANYQINAPGVLNSPNVIGAGTNVGNLFIGPGNQVAGSSIYNLIVGGSILITGGTFNIVTGSSITLQTGSSGNLLGGYNTNNNGDNNIANGIGHDIDGSNVAAFGTAHQVDAASAGTTVNGVVVGAGGQLKIPNSFVIGGTSSPDLFGGKGAMQTILVNMAGYVEDVIHPELQPITLGTDTGTSLHMNYNSMVWDIVGRVVAVQTATGNLHTNTSAIGDWIAFEFSLTATRSSGGTITLSDVKFLDHRNRWIPLASPDPIAYRSISVDDGTNADICLVRPSITASGTNILCTLVFPGYAEAMTDQGAARTPRYAIYLANADVPMPTINAGAASDGVIQDTITVAAAPITTALFRDPYGDIFDGNDGNGTGYYGGVGVGATLIAETTETGIIDIGLFDGGSYNNIVATVAFTFGDAAATCTMSANSDHIGNNVGFTAGNYGCPDGNYPFTFAGGSGTGATGYATITGGQVTSTTITYGGDGYTTGDVPVLTIPGALPVTVAAVFTPTLYYRVTGVNITVPGTLYRNTSDLSVTFAGAGIAQAQGYAMLMPAEVTTAGGATGSITVDKGGKGYGISRPGVSLMDRGGVTYETGNGGSFRGSGSWIISQQKYA